MKARVKETGEIIDVSCLYPVIYSRLDCNGKIKEEYNEDELEFLNAPSAIVSLDKALKWLEDHYFDYGHNRLGFEYLKNDFREAMERN